MTRLAKQKQTQVDRQLIIKLKKEFAGNRDVRRRIIGSLPEQSKMARDFDESGLAIFDLPEGADPAAIAKAVETDVAVQFAEPNFTDSGTWL